MSEYLKTINLFPIPLYVTILRPSFFILGIGVHSRYIELSFGWIAVGFLYNPV